ncbi:MAG: hypothetical protein PHN78_01380 [Dehalococcoidales bacterium]|nr:hypothetical protein [Dehalococcoidales bacterium]
MNVLSYTIRNINPITFLTYPTSLGMSESAHLIQRESNELQRSLTRSITFGERLSKMLECLFQVKKERSVDNWDGYGAKAIDDQSYNNAISFILSLPSNIPIPDIDVEPDGEVVFEWYEGRRQVFSVSIGARNELTYAGLYGASKAHGVEYLEDEIPSAIMNNINRVYTKGR